MDDERFEILDGFSEADFKNGVNREVVYEGDGIIRVATRSDYDDYEERHFRLVEVKQQWVEVES